MTPQTTGQNSPALFTEAQWRHLRALQARYLQGLHLFSSQELARLTFLRWLCQNASLGEAGFEYLNEVGRDALTAETATRGRRPRRRPLPGGRMMAPGAGEQPANTRRNHNESGVERKGDLA